MSDVKSFNLYKIPKNENPLKITWESLKSMNRFTRFMVLFFFLFSLATPFIVNNYQVFNSRAQIDSEPSTQESQNNIYDFCSQFQNIEAAIKCEDALD
ncbi:hypothetical protein HYT32_00985, partial [Candidatus Roizmanbacteria bacterium]|nr:hypothetical protein [Candidatus Roizmanbacteria bacterium]